MLFGILTNWTDLTAMFNSLFTLFKYIYTLCNCSSFVVVVINGIVIFIVYSIGKM